MRRFMQVFVLGVFLCLTSASSANTARTAPKLEELPCMDCDLEETFDPTWVNCEINCGPPTYIYRHKLSGSCGSWSNGGDLSLSGASGRRKPTIALVEESDGGCVRCGGTSSCHTTWDEGGCHVACGSGGASNKDPLGKLEKAIRVADASAVRSLLSPENGLSYNMERHSVQVIRECDPELIEYNIDLTPAVARRIESLLQIASAAPSH